MRQDETRQDDIEEEEGGDQRMKGEDQGTRGEDIDEEETENK